MELDRRQVMLGIGSLTTAGLAGCSSGDAGGGGADDDDDDDGDSSDDGYPSAPASDWLPARENPDAPATLLTYHGTASLREWADTAAYDRDGIRQEFGGVLPGVGDIRRDDITGTGYGRDYSLTFGSFDVEPIVKDFTSDDGVSLDRTYQGFDIVTGSDSVAAVSSDVVITALTEEQAVSFVDTNVGSASPLGSNDDVVSSALDHVEGVAAAWISVPGVRTTPVGRPGEPPVEAEGLTITGETTQVDLAYGTENALPQWEPEELREHLDNIGLADITVNSSSDLVTATATFPTSELDLDTLRYSEADGTEYPIPDGL